MENQEIYYIEESQSWICPIAGRWKVICVGGGASGASTVKTATVPGNSTSFGTLITANGGISTADGTSSTKHISGYGGYNGLIYGGIPGSSTSEWLNIGTGNTIATNATSGGVPMTALGWGAGGGAATTASASAPTAGRAGEIRTSIVTIEAGESVPCTVGKGGITEDAGAANGADGVIVLQYLGV